MKRGLKSLMCPIQVQNSRLGLNLRSLALEGATFIIGPASPDHPHPHLTYSYLTRQVVEE